MELPRHPLGQPCAWWVWLVTQSCLSLCDPMDYRPFRLLCAWDSPGKNTGVGSHSLLLGIFPTQGSNPSLLHCRGILYCWATREARLCPSYCYWVINCPKLNGIKQWVGNPCRFCGSGIWKEAFGDGWLISILWLEDSWARRVTACVSIPSSVWWEWCWYLWNLGKGQMNQWCVKGVSAVRAYAQLMVS